MDVIVSYMQTTTIKKGIHLQMPGAPSQCVDHLADLGESNKSTTTIQRVAVSGEDFPRLQPEFKISQGDNVALGQALFSDRNTPEIVFTSPVSGSVTRIETARRRTLGLLEIKCQDQGLAALRFTIPDDPSNREAIQTLLLESGLWTALRTRPFSRIPKPTAKPADLFVTAMDTEPLAADPRIVLQPDLDKFRQGLLALSTLTDGTTYVCQTPGEPLAGHLKESIRDVAFSGHHPTGLAGTHIHALSPVSRDKSVWSINYQDVIALGELLDSGTLRNTRVVALSGSGFKQPRLVRAPLGANLAELTRNECASVGAHLISGSVLSGKEREWLGRFHCQVTAIHPAPAQESWLASIEAWLNKRFPGNSAIIPDSWLDQVSPLTDLTVPLLRALSIGDIEAAEAMGSLGFAADDIAPLSYACTTNHDYAALLDQSLEQMRGEFELRAGAIDD